MTADRLVFTGHIAGFGTGSGVRMVVGSWRESPFGRFADVTYAYRFGPPPHAGVRATFGSLEATWKVPLASLR